MLENFMNAEQLNLIQLMAMRKEEGGRLPYTWA